MKRGGNRGLRGARALNNQINIVIFYDPTLERASFRETGGLPRVFCAPQGVRFSAHRRTHDFFVLDAADWVNVVALTPEGNMILIEQFRHGSETVELEIPGGSLTRKTPLCGRRLP